MKWYKLAKYVRTAVCFPAYKDFMSGEVVENTADRLKECAKESDPSHLSNEQRAAIAWSYTMAFLQNPSATFCFADAMHSRGIDIFPQIPFSDFERVIGDVVKMLAYPRVMGFPTQGQPDRFLDGLPAMLNAPREIIEKCAALYTDTESYKNYRAREIVDRTDPGWHNPLMAVALASCFSPVAYNPPTKI